MPVVDLAALVLLLTWAALIFDAVQPAQQACYLLGTLVGKSSFPVRRCHCRPALLGMQQC